MKKVFSVFMIFFAVFLVSCGGLLEEDSQNTVRITMPGNGRAVSASGASDVDYYNIQIASQSFSNVSPGTTVESMQLPVGMSISISVEAIGDLKENGNVVDSGRRVAYYQTSERLPAEGLTLNVNMANYKTEYHKVKLDPNGFNGQQTSVEVYVAGGSNYTLPNYGTYTPPQGAPRKHTTWESKDPAMVKQVGESITVTEDMIFSVQWEELATITFYAYSIGRMSGDNISGSISGWTGTAYVRKNTRYTLPTFTSFTYNERSFIPLGWEYGNSSVANLGESVEITSDTGFYLQTKGQLPLTVIGATINVNDTITEKNGQYYIWTREPFTLPTGRKDDDGSEVTMWQTNLGDRAPGVSLSYDDWGSEASFGFFEIGQY